jgi:tRNA(Ile)-lysidine synthase
MRTTHALRVDHAGQCLRLYRDAVYWELADSAEPPDDGTGTPHPDSSLVERRRGGICRHGAARSCVRRGGGGQRRAVPEALLRSAGAQRSSGGERLRTSPGGPGRR